MQHGPASEDLARRRRAVIERFGPWTAHNIRLHDDLYTMGPRLAGPSELNLKRVMQLLSDHASKPLEDLRVLDLGCLEGLYAVELARQGAEVVAIEAREANVARARFAREALSLGNLDVVHDDVRSLSKQRYGEFDAVLALGILYHLDAPDCFRLLENVAEVCRALAVIETQVSLYPRRTLHHDGRVYAGKLYEENVANQWAAIGNRQSFWLTKPSLLNLLGDVGFTSVCECLTPLVADLARYRDHVLLMARKGSDVELLSAPGVGELGEAAWRWPERIGRAVHPTQHWRHRLADRARRAVRRDFARRTFRKRPLANDQSTAAGSPPSGKSLSR